MWAGVTYRSVSSARSTRVRSPLCLVIGHRTGHRVIDCIELWWSRSDGCWIDRLIYEVGKAANRETRCATSSNLLHCRGAYLISSFVRSSQPAIIISFESGRGRPPPAPAFLSPSHPPSQRRLGRASEHPFPLHSFSIHASPLRTMHIPSLYIPITLSISHNKIHRPPYACACPFISTSLAPFCAAASAASAPLIVRISGVVEA